MSNPRGLEASTDLGEVIKYSRNKILNSRGACVEAPWLSASSQPEAQYAWFDLASNKDRNEIQASSFLNVP